MSVTHHHRAKARRREPLLICLDLQRDYVATGRPRYAPANAAVAEACIGVLKRARAGGWRIVHSQRQRALEAAFGAALFNAPIEGLRPLISEPVFIRRCLSAFSEPEFAAELHEAKADTVYLIGFSLADTCLATTLAAVDHGLTLTLIEDALGGVAADGEPAARFARSILSPFARFIASQDIPEVAGEFAL
jgi:nicotinamidase-related amidase